jgi:hypothetical protein
LFRKNGSLLYSREEEWMMMGKKNGNETGKSNFPCDNVNWFVCWEKGWVRPLLSRTFFSPVQLLWSVCLPVYSCPKFPPLFRKHLNCRPRKHKFHSIWWRFENSWFVFFALAPVDGKIKRFQGIFIEHSIRTSTRNIEHIIFDQLFRALRDNLLNPE